MYSFIPDIDDEYIEKGPLGDELISDSFATVIPLAIDNMTIRIIVNVDNVVFTNFKKISILINICFTISKKISFYV
tara:strand:+ start:11309 stop:11536 length:228 start_codon:yes stop_codon:yes gene_type:complete